MKKIAMKLILAFMMILTSVVFGVKINSIKTSPKPAESNINSSEPSKFILKVSDGSVSLFEGERIIETFSEVNFSMLPSDDKSLLEDGIEFESIEEAYRLIEDFDG